MGANWIAQMMAGDDSAYNPDKRGGFMGALNTPENFGKLMAPGDIATDVAKEPVSRFPGISKFIASPEFPVALAGLGKLALGAGGVRGQKENTFNDIVYEMAKKRSQSAADRKAGMINTQATRQPPPNTTTTPATRTAPISATGEATANERMKKEQQRSFMSSFLR